MRAFAMVLNQFWSSHGNLPYATDANLLISALVRHSGAFIERGRRVSSPGCRPLWCRCNNTCMRALWKSHHSGCAHVLGRFPSST